jgi:hypothetical protein
LTRLLVLLAAPRDNNITQRNIILVPLTDRNPFQFPSSVGNPYERAITTRLRLEAPEGWTIEESDIPFDDPFVMQAGERKLVKITLRTAALPSGRTVSVYQTVEGAGHDEALLGGITIRLASE